MSAATDDRRRMSRDARDVSVIFPTGMLGGGFPAETVERGIELGADAIAVDGGSTDSGPYYLGTGTAKTTEAAVEHDLVARRKVDRRHRKRNLGVLDAALAEDLTNVLAYAAAREQCTPARQSDPEDRPRDRVEDVADLVGRVSARVHRRGRCADARTGDVVDQEPGTVEDA